MHQFPSKGQWSFSLAMLIVGILALLFLPPAEGAVPDWPEQVEVGSLLVLDAADGLECSWGITGERDGQAYEPVWREFKGLGSSVAIETKYPAVLVVELRTNATRGMRSIQWSILVGEGPAPNPGPDPPTPQPTKLFAVLVDETEDRQFYTQEQINAITDTADQEYMAAKGFRYHKVDQDTVEPDGQGGERPPLEIASFLVRAKSHKAVTPAKEGGSKNPNLPRLMISDMVSGKLLYDDIVTGPVLPILKQYGGE